MSTQNQYPKLHNAMWPGLVGKEPGTDHPPISLEHMLEMTAKAEVMDRGLMALTYSFSTRTPTLTPAMTISRRWQT